MLTCFQMAGSFTLTRVCRDPSCVMICWGHQSTLPRMRFKYHPLHDPQKMNHTNTVPWARVQIRKDLGRNLVSRWLGWESPCGVSILFSEPFFSGSLWSEVDWNVHYWFWAFTYWSQRNLSLCLLTLRLAVSLTAEPLTDGAGPLPRSLMAQEPDFAHWSQRSTALLAGHAGTLSYAFIVQGHSLIHRWCWSCIFSVRIRIHQSWQLWSLHAGC